MCAFVKTATVVFSTDLNETWHRPFGSGKEELNRMGLESENIFQHFYFPETFLSASLYFSKRGAY